MCFASMCLFYEKGLSYEAIGPFSREEVTLLAACKWYPEGLFKVSTVKRPLSGRPTKVFPTLKDPVLVIAESSELTVDENGLCTTPKSGRLFTETPMMQVRCSV